MKRKYLNKQPNGNNMEGTQSTKVKQGVGHIISQVYKSKVASVPF